MIVLSALAVNAFTLTACNKKDKNEEKNYFDLDSVKEQMDKEEINAVVKDFQYDDKPCNIMKLTATIGDEYFYYFSPPNIKIDLNDETVSYVCDRPGCAHTEQTPGCTAYSDFVSPVATTDGIYYTALNADGCSMLKLYADGKDTVILVNEYYTDYEEENYPENKCLASSLCFYGNDIYMIAPSYYFVYNRDTKEIGEMKKMTDNICYSFAVSDNYVYFSNDNLEMYLQDKESGENKKLADKVGQLCFANGRLYYVQYEGDMPILYSAAEDGSDPVKIAEDCYVNYVVTDSCIYYQNYIGGNDVYKCDLNGENVEKIEFKNAPENYSLPTLKISSCSAIDHVFFIDEESFFINNGSDTGLMFTVKKGESDANSIMIEKDY